MFECVCVIRGGSDLHLDSISNNIRSPLGRVSRLARSLQSVHYVKVAPNADAALVLTICSVLDEELKRELRRDFKTQSPSSCKGTRSLTSED